MSKIEKVIEYLNNNSELDIDWDKHLSGKNDEDVSFSEIKDFLSENDAFDGKEAYSGLAMEFLNENDVLLNESIGEALNAGFELGGLNSIVLANLLKKKYNIEDFEELEDGVNEFIDELKEQEEAFNEYKEEFVDNVSKILFDEDFEYLEFDQKELISEKLDWFIEQLKESKMPKVEDNEITDYDIPFLKFKKSWNVKIIHPFNGASVRFIVKKGEKEVSVYLDEKNKLGVSRAPYWEIYDSSYTMRFRINNTEGLIDGIEKMLNE
jgi:hypothetical protein